MTEKCKKYSFDIIITKNCKLQIFFHFVFCLRLSDAINLLSFLDLYLRDLFFSWLTCDQDLSADQIPILFEVTLLTTKPRTWVKAVSKEIARWEHFHLVHQELGTCQGNLNQFSSRSYQEWFLENLRKFWDLDLMVHEVSRLFLFCHPVFQQSPHRFQATWTASNLWMHSHTLINASLTMIAGSLHSN